jgi:hypothetical protein
MNLVRIKLDGMKCVEFDPERVSLIRIVPASEEYDDQPLNKYMLSITIDMREIILCVGSFDQCHLKLHDLHDKLGISVRDV